MKVDFADGINVMQGIDQNIFKGLTETLTELNLNDTENGSTSESSSQEASSLMFEEGILIGNRSLYDNSHVDPLHININLSKSKYTYMMDMIGKILERQSVEPSRILKQHKQHKQWLRRRRKA